MKRKNLKEKSNKKLGNDFEKELSIFFGQKHCWVHNFASKQEGQPADLIIVTKGHAYLMDAKVCSNDVFVTSRIEPNQHTAMNWWYLLNDEPGWFALKTSQGIYVADYPTLSDMTKVTDFSQFPTLEQWCENHNIQ